jgi:Zn-dependent protease with chaperone function
MTVASEAMRGRYYDGKTAAVREVFVVPTPGEVILRDIADRALVARWPIVELRVLGDSEHEAVPLLVRANDEARLAIEDAESRRALCALIPEISKLGAPRPSAVGRVAQFAAALTVAIGLLWLALEAGSGLLAPLVPYSLQARLGEHVYGQMVAGRALCRGREGSEAINLFASRLAAEAEYDHPISVRVVKGGPVNAFTLPGGILVFYSDLIDRAKDGNELGGVIAHEMGHVVRYHPIQGIARQYGIEQILKAVTGGYSEVGTLGSGGSLLLALRNGRTFEREADATGVSLLEKLGLRADGMSRFFGELMRNEPHDPAAAMGILSDHPPTEERIASTRRPPTGAPDFTDREWQAIRSMCR